MIPIPKRSKCIILAGQSNAQGAYGSPDINLQSAFTRVQVWTGSTFAALEYNVNNEGADPNDAGCELKLADLLESYNNDVYYLIKYAVSSSAIDDLAGESDFNSESNELFATLINEIQSARKQIKNEDFAFIWIQGEKDARFEASSLEYEANMTAFINQLRTQTGITNMPVILNRLATDQRNVFTPPEYHDNVRAAQVSTVSNINNCYMLDLDNAQIGADGLHFDATGQATIASRIYQILQDIKFLPQN